RGGGFVKDEARPGPPRVLNGPPRRATIATVVRGRGPCAPRPSRNGQEGRAGSQDGFGEGDRRSWARGSGPGGEEDRLCRSRYPHGMGTSTRPRSSSSTRRPRSWYASSTASP